MERIRHFEGDIDFVANAFPPEMRGRVRREQGHKCDMCGVKPRTNGGLEVHHRLPESMGGGDKRDNAVALCHGDHKFADHLAIKYGITYEQAKAFVETAPQPLFYKEEPYGTRK